MDEAHVHQIALSATSLNRLDQYAWNYNGADEDYHGWTSVPINEASNIDNPEDDEAELRTGININQFDIMDGLDGPEVLHRR